MARIPALQTLLVIAAVLAGCDDDEATMDLNAIVDASCHAPDLAYTPGPDAGEPSPLCGGTACGGDLTGTWKVVAACASGTGDASFLGCASGTLTYHEFAVSGTFTFGADGTLSTSADEHFAGQAHLQRSCYALASSCADLTALAAAAGIGASCVPSCLAGADDCDCAITLDQKNVTLNGTFTTDGAGGITLKLGKETIPGHYCVSGDELWVGGTRFGSVEYRYRMQRM